MGKYIFLPEHNGIFNFIRILLIKKIERTDHKAGGSICHIMWHLHRTADQHIKTSHRPTVRRQKPPKNAQSIWKDSSLKNTMESVISTWEHAQRKCTGQFVEPRVFLASLISVEQGCEVAQVWMWSGQVDFDFSSTAGRGILWEEATTAVFLGAVPGPRLWACIHCQGCSWKGLTAAMPEWGRAGLRSSPVKGLLVGKSTCSWNAELGW